MSVKYKQNISLQFRCMYLFFINSTKRNFSTQVIIMRVLILSAILVSSIAAKTQTLVPGGFMSYMHPSVFTIYPHYIAGGPDKKWSLTSYAGITTGYGFYNGSNSIFAAAPVGLQINRRISNNLYAFAGVSAAPAYMNFNHAFISSDINKANPNGAFFKSNSFGAYSRAELGLMYVNDAKTFSISGSIGVERSSPLIPYQQMSRNSSSTHLHQ